MKQSSRIAPLNVEEYLVSFPEATQHLIERLRKTIGESAPLAEEFISYQMLAYKQNGILVYFAAYEKHIGFYATPNGYEAFKKELSKYKIGKGSVQFPLDEPLPFSLIGKIVKFKVKENSKKAKSKAVFKNK